MKLASSSRRLATAATEAPTGSAPSPAALPSDPKLNKIVDDISGLTLLQAADLVSLLKVCDNFSYIPLAAYISSYRVD